MHRRWRVRLVDQERGVEGPWLEDMRRSALGHMDQPAVTFELLCNGEVVFALHSPSKRNAQGEIFTITMVDGRYPLDVFQSDMEERGLA